MAKSGQARVPTAQQQRHLFEVIRQHRHPEKNTAIMQISFKLGLRAPRCQDSCRVSGSVKVVDRGRKAVRNESLFTGA